MEFLSRMRIGYNYKRKARAEHNSYFMIKYLLKIEIRSTEDDFK